MIYRVIYSNSISFIYDGFINENPKKILSNVLFCYNIVKSVLRNYEDYPLIHRSSLDQTKILLNDYLFSALVLLNHFP